MNGLRTGVTKDFQIGPKTGVMKNGKKRARVCVERSMAVSWDTSGVGGEMGRIRGQRGSFCEKYQGMEKKLSELDRPPLVDIVMALNLTVAGIVAHESALKGGEWWKIPQYKI